MTPDIRLYDDIYGKINRTASPIHLRIKCIWLGRLPPTELSLVPSGAYPIRLPKESAPPSGQPETSLRFNHPHKPLIHHLQRRGNNADPPHRGDKVRVPVPPGHHMHMQMTRDPGPSCASLVHPDIHTLRLERTLDE